MTDFPASSTQVTKPKEVDLYIDAIQRKKQAEADEKKYRPNVVEFCKEFGSLANLEYAAISKTKFDYDKIRQWVADTYPPEVYAQVITEAINVEEFMRLVKMGVIDVNEMPSTCYEETTEHRLTVKKETK